MADEVEGLTQVAAPRFLTCVPGYVGTWANACHAQALSTGLGSWWALSKYQLYYYYFAELMGRNHRARDGRTASVSVDKDPGAGWGRGWPGVGGRGRGGDTQAQEGLHPGGKGRRVPSECGGSTDGVRPLSAMRPSPGSLQPSAGAVGSGTWAQCRARLSPAHMQPSRVCSVQPGACRARGPGLGPSLGEDPGQRG